MYHEYFFENGHAMSSKFMQQKNAEVIYFCLLKAS